MVSFVLPRYCPTLILWTKIFFIFLFLVIKNSFLKNIFYLLCSYNCLICSHLYSPPLCTPLPSLFPHLSSCPWVTRISSFASPFSILFLTSPCLFCTYHLCFLIPEPVPPFFPLCLPVISNSVYLFLL